MFRWLHLRFLVNKNIKQMLLKSYIFKSKVFTVIPDSFLTSPVLTVLLCLPLVVSRSLGCESHAFRVACAPETLLDSGVGRGRAVSQMAKVALVHLARISGCRCGSRFMANSFQVSMKTRSGNWMIWIAEDNYH